MNVPGESPFIIAPLAGFSPQIGRLVAMLTYVRRVTVDSVAGLTVDQLDYLASPTGNSVGALLAHIAAVEVACQVDTFEERELNTEEILRLGSALSLGERARAEIRGRDLGYYLDLLTDVRRRTLAELARRDDVWLEATSAFRGGLPTNNHFLWFHVLEDEISHCGQIRLLRRMILV